MEITIRTIQSRLLLRPSPELNEIVRGVLGRALSLYDVKLAAFSVMSNHIHLLVTPANGKELADFMGYVNGNLSKEVGRLHDWTGTLWDRRYRAINVVDDDAQVARLRYLLSQGCKEGFVDRPADWPGANCVEALLGGTTMTGTWIDRTARYEACRRGEEVAAEAFEERYPVTLTPLPCWRELSEDEYRHRCGDLVADIERETATRNAKLGRKPLGAAWVMAQNPHDRPLNSSKSPAPRVHASTKKARKLFMAACRRFVDGFRRAADLLKQGHREVEFPLYSFPPGAPFVSEPHRAVVVT